MKTKMKHLISLVTMLVIMVCSVVPSSVDAVTLSREYLKYDMSTKTTTAYTLSLSSDTSTYNLIGADDRRTETRSENTGIINVFISTRNPETNEIDSMSSTGFIVGDHVIATAAHCVYTDRGFPLSASANLYNEDGSIILSALTVKEIHIPAEYATCVSNNTTETTSGVALDYALITVEEDLSDCTHFSLSNVYNAQAAALSNVSVFVTGIPGWLYPTSGGPVQNSSYQIYTDAGKILQAYGNDTPILYYDADATDGNSGGPVYIIEEYQVGSTTYYEYAVIAIHHGGITNLYNDGARVNMQLMQFYGANDNIAY